MSVQINQPKEQKKRGVFPRWLRLVVSIIALISLVVAAIIWIWHVWGDLSNTLSAIFTALGTLFGFLALPFLYSSHEPQASPSQPVPVQVVNYFGSDNASQLPSSNSVTEKTKELQEKSVGFDSQLPEHQLPIPTGQVNVERQKLIADDSHSSKKQSSNEIIQVPKQAYVLDATLHYEISKILEGLPAIASFQGRNSLLIGIPRNIVSGLQRDSNSDSNDIENIITQLDGLGPLETGEQPLVIFMQNASRRTEGLAVHKTLNTILEELKRRYGLSQ